MCIKSVIMLSYNADRKNEKCTYVHQCSYVTVVLAYNIWSRKTKDYNILM